CKIPTAAKQTALDIIRMYHKDGTPFHTALKLAYKHTKTDLQSYDKEQSAIHADRHRAAAQKLIHTKPRLANKAIFQPSSKRHTITALHDDRTGALATDPTHLVQVADRYFTRTWAATGSKTGTYLPEHCPRKAPWEQPNAIDRFTLKTGATQREEPDLEGNRAKRAWLNSTIQDTATFHTCLKQLSNGKAPGPDDIPNELLKMLPDEITTAIHDMFTVLWATGLTPIGWKTSNTVLIYKNKGSETDLANYRPIGLANTLYKLWTRMITVAIYEYAEQHNVLSSCQAGFRRHQDTTLLQINPCVRPCVLTDLVRSG
ncbi:hypothetical protein, partial [Bosea sp. (in: a-proteobacteria)]|uniref:hypothetical protein n=1 Tax=Bosea sp. (in: a-proteobacteria) TaxID=1871050 RepID=UPI004034AC97